MTTAEDAELHALFKECQQLTSDYYWRAALRGHPDVIVIVADLGDAWAVRQLERLGLPSLSPSDAPRFGMAHVMSVLGAATPRLAALLGIEWPDFHEPPAHHYRVLVLAAGRAALILVAEPLAGLLGPSPASGN